MIAGAFTHADQMVRDVEGSKHDILIVAFDPIILETLIRYAEEINKQSGDFSKRR